MVTQTSVDTFVSQDGEIRYNGVLLGSVAFEATITREVIEVGRVGKYSDLNLPGKVTFSGKLQYGLVDPQFFLDALNDGTTITTASEETLHASLAGTGAEQFVTSGFTNPTTPRVVKITTATTDTLTADAIIVKGTDVNDQPLTEVIPFTSSPGSFIGSQVFKTVNAYIVPASMNANDSFTLYGVGQRTTPIAKPKYFTLLAKVVKGTKTIQLTLNNCWFTQMPMILGDANEAELPEQEFMVRDPQADISLVDIA